MKHMGITVDGLDGLLLSLEEIMDLPDAVAREMLGAEAEIVEEAQRRTGEAMGVHRTGATLDAIGHTGMKRGPDGTRSLSVSLRGTNAKGVRNAEVAFLNEYGVPGRGIPARPFIRTANEQAADSAVNAAAEVYDEFLKGKGF